MRGITFNNLPPIRPIEPGRMDVAFFIGLAPLAQSPLFSETLKNWLADYGWDKARIDQLSDDPELIRNTPIPLETWDAFCSVFDERRLDRINRLRSLSLKDPVDIVKNDRDLHVIVDGQEIPVTLRPAVNGRLSLSRLVDQINDTFDNESFKSVASASLDPDTGSNLIIQRNEKVRKGELSVYRNESLGFPESLQSDSRYLQNYSAAAIKAFFRNGGVKCYFLCMGDPLSYDAYEIDGLRKLYALIWGEQKAKDLFNDGRSISRSDLHNVFFPEIPGASSPVVDWQGLSHLAGLSDVIYVCLPDMVDLLGKAPDAGPTEFVSEDKEVFVECTKTVQDKVYYTTIKQAPLYDKEAYLIWKRVIDHILDYLYANACTVQLVAALPLPEKDLHRKFKGFVFEELLPGTEDSGRKQRRLQLAFPWLKTRWSGDLPESLEPPEGALLGLLADRSIRFGAFRSIAGASLYGVYDLSPLDIDAYGTDESGSPSLSSRISWFDFVPDGIALQSDVTAVFSGNYRYGAVRRIMMIIQRAGRTIGLDHVFEPSSEHTWRTVSDSLKELLNHIYLNNGLRGRSAKEAYSVSCGRSTMTQNDIDNGRLIADISLQPAVPIERIAVDILLNQDETVFLESAD